MHSTGRYTVLLCSDGEKKEPPLTIHWLQAALFSCFISSEISVYSSHISRRVGTYFSQPIAMT